MVRQSMGSLRPTASISCGHRGLSAHRVERRVPAVPRGRRCRRGAALEALRDVRMSRLERALERDAVAGCSASAASTPSPAREYADGSLLKASVSRSYALCSGVAIPFAASENWSPTDAIGRYANRPDCTWWSELPGAASPNHSSWKRSLPVRQSPPPPYSAASCV